MQKNADGKIIKDLDRVLPHPVLLRNRFLWNVRYDSGNVLRSSLTVVPDVFPHHV